MPYWYVKVSPRSGNDIGVVVEAKDAVEAKWKGLLLMYQKGLFKEADAYCSVYPIQDIEDSILNPSARSVSDNKT